MPEQEQTEPLQHTPVGLRVDEKELFLLAARQQGAVWRQKYVSLYGSGMSADGLTCTHIHPSTHHI